MLFNICTNDQPVQKNTRSFIYADDLCIATHDASYKKTESTLSDALDNIGEYYARNHLHANPEKTQTCVFHIRNREAKTNAEHLVVRQKNLAHSNPNITGSYS